MSQVSNTSFTTTVSSNAMAVVDYLSKSMMSALPFIVCAALFRTVAVIMGEGMLGLWSADSDIYRLFYSWLYNAGYYFLPIYLGWAAARQLGCSEQLGMMLGGVLIAPDLLKLVDVASTTAASMTSVYGLFPAPVNDYTTTVIPVLISVPVLWRVECFFQRVIPKAVAFSFVPFATMLVMVPVSLCITAPAGSYLGMLLGQLMLMLGNSGGIVSLLTLMGLAAGWEFLKIAGVSNVVLSLAYAQFMSVGTDSCILIAATMATFAVWGMPFGASLRIADKDEKALMLGYSISGVLGGVSEPALYGCGFKYGKVPDVHGHWRRRRRPCCSRGPRYGLYHRHDECPHGHWLCHGRYFEPAVVLRCRRHGICGVCGAELLLWRGADEGASDGGRSRFTRNLEERGRSKRVNLCDTRTIPLPYSKAVARVGCGLFCIWGTKWLHYNPFEQ